MNDIFINEENYKQELKIGIINNKELVRLFGNEKHKTYLRKYGKVCMKSKDAMLNNAKKFCKIEVLRRGKYNIIEIYDTPIDKNKFETRRVDYDFVNYDSEYDKMNGVYCVKLENKIYIGSTISGFRNRHSAYKFNIKNNNTKNWCGGDLLISKGGKIEILWATESNNELEIRLKEIEYIQYYDYFTDFEVINSVSQVSVLNSKNKIKYNKIKILDKDFEKAKQLLSENGIIFKN